MFIQHLTPDSSSYVLVRNPKTADDAALLVKSRMSIK